MKATSIYERYRHADEYERYKHCLGVKDYEGNTITKAKLLVWSRDYNRKLICVYCGNEPIEVSEYIYCKICKEYKGIIPDISASATKSCEALKCVCFLYCVEHRLHCYLCQGRISYPNCTGHKVCRYKEVVIKNRA